MLDSTLLLFLYFISGAIAVMLVINFGIAKPISWFSHIILAIYIVVYSLQDPTSSKMLQKTKDVLGLLAAGALFVEVFFAFASGEPKKTFISGLISVFVLAFLLNVLYEVAF